jgi:hypothetical protein
MSEAAYLSPVEAEARFRTLGFEQTKTFAHDSMIGYVVSAQDVAVVVFRGTDDPADWLVNIDNRSIESAHGAIHRGFYNAYQPLKPQIAKLLEQCQPSHLWITGHSLGGALAVVSALDLSDDKTRALDGVVTFGQPMVTRYQLAEHVNSVLLGRYAHYVNDADIVPRVPPTYEHCGLLVWFTPSGIKRSKPKHPVFGAAPGERTSETGGDLEPLSDQEFEQLRATLREEKTGPKRLPDGTMVFEGKSPFIKDHAMALYLEKIRAVVAGPTSK